MENKKMPRRAFLILLCLLLLLPLFPVSQAQAGNETYPDHPGKLTVQFSHKYENTKEKRMIPGVTAKVYCVATMDTSAQFTMCEAFKSVKADINEELNQDQWAQLGQDLEKLVKKNNIQEQLKKTGGEEGAVTFENLEPGLYLLTYGEGVHPDFPNIRVGFQTTLVSVPFRGKNTDNVFDLDEEGYWDYDFTVIPKPYELKEICKLQKVWKDEEADAAARPRSLDFEIEYEDGAKQTVTLTSKGGWLLEFDPVTLSPIKTIKETKVPDGYEFKGWETIGGTVQVTNEKKTQTSPTPSSPSPVGPKPLPNTGMLWWPVPVLLVVGAVLVLFGWMQRRKKQ